VNTVGTTNIEATSSRTPTEVPSPENQALGETVGPLVRHDEAEELARNLPLSNACEDREFDLIKQAVREPFRLPFFNLTSACLERSRRPTPFDLAP